MWLGLGIGLGLGLRVRVKVDGSIPNPNPNPQLIEARQYEDIKAVDRRIDQLNLELHLANTYDELRPGQTPEPLTLTLIVTVNR